MIMSPLIAFKGWEVLYGGHKDESQRSWAPEHIRNAQKMVYRKGAMEAEEKKGSKDLPEENKKKPL